MGVAKLVLSNGMVFEGIHIGAQVQTSGELVFTTSMTGYSESMSDPSFCGQILVFSYPLIGNYGLPINQESSDHFHLAAGLESSHSWLAGVIVSSHSDFSSHSQFKSNLHDWLTLQGVPGITGIDTRELVKVIRSSEMLLGKIIIENVALSTNDSFYNPNTENLVAKVSTSVRKILSYGKPKVAVVDFGVKHGILNKLIELGCQVEVVPWNEKLSTVDCDGFLLSNGPGDPKSVHDIFPGIKELVDQNKKILGICLGHQILALSMGATTKRLPFGHRGYNHPVEECKTGRGYMTSQNHSYFVCDQTLDKAIWDVSFVNANDQSIEGITHKFKPVKGIQFHPEASGGPNDCLWILEDFVKSLS